MSYWEGYKAFQNGKPYESCPYPFVDEEESDHKWWVSGWYDARSDSK
jgi:ribosome modulation factor